MYNTLNCESNIPVGIYYLRLEYQHTINIKYLWKISLNQNLYSQFLINLSDIDFWESLCMNFFTFVSAAVSHLVYSWGIEEDIIILLFRLMEYHFQITLKKIEITNPDVKDPKVLAELTHAESTKRIANPRFIRNRIGSFYL